MPCRLFLAVTLVSVTFHTDRSEANYLKRVILVFATVRHLEEKLFCPVVQAKHARLKTVLLW